MRTQTWSSHGCSKPSSGSSSFPDRVESYLSSPTLREIIESPYRIVYRLLDESVEILTVFRASRLFRSAFED
jgi:plasmid stabilization system protein ParE